MIDDTTPVAMTLGVKAPLLETKVATRAHGTVGGIGTDNKWAEEQLYVFSFEQGKYDKAFIHNLPVKAPKASENVANGAINDLLYPAGSTIPNPDYDASAGTGSATIDVSNEPYYYMGETIYEFYGYYIDDAYATEDYSDYGWKASTTTTGPAPKLAASAVTVPFVINGGQDLMIAKTDKATDLAGKTGVAPSKLYSAYSARRSVVPNLQFEHVLSRFTFKVKAGAESAGDILVESIKLRSNDRGTLNIVGGKDAVTWNAPASTLPALELKKKNSTSGLLEAIEAQPIKVTAPNNGGQFDKEAQSEDPIGESLMVAPGQETYTLVLSRKFRNYTADEITKLDTDKPNHGKTINDPISSQPIPDQEITIKMSDVVLSGTALGAGAKAEAGKSYEVILVVYGPEPVDVQVTLKPWTNSGTVDVDEEKNYGDYVEVLNNAVTISSEAVTGTAASLFTVYSDGEWTAVSDKEWLVLDGDGDGANNADVKYTVSANPTATDRTANVTVTLDSDPAKKATVLVTQKGATPATPAAPAIKINPASVTITAEEGTATATVTANYTATHTWDYDFTGTATWIDQTKTSIASGTLTVTAASGLTSTDNGTTTFKVKDTANTDAEPVTVTVTLNITD